MGGRPLIWGAGNRNGGRYRGATAKRLSSAGDIVHFLQEKTAFRLYFNSSSFAGEPMWSPIVVFVPQVPMIFGHRSLLETQKFPLQRNKGSPKSLECSYMILKFYCLQEDSN